jgi:hypothetical protein
MKKLAIASGGFCLLLCAVPAPRSLRAAQQDATAKHDMHLAGQDMKNAAKKTGSATKKEAKKGFHKSAKATNHAAGKVENKTEPND